MDDIRKYEILTDDQEADLVKKNSEGDHEARNLLVLHNLRYAYTLSIRAKNLFSAADFMDLLAEASYALFEAASKFDHTRGTKFITYAHRCIWNRIKKYIRQNLYPCRLSASEVSRLLMINRYIDLSRQIDNTRPSVKDIAAVTNIDEKECKRILYFVDNDNDPFPESYTNGYKKVELMKDLEDHLSSDEFEILVAVYGLDGAPPRKQREIAKLKKISDEMVKVKKQEALFRLSKVFGKSDTMLLARAKAAVKIEIDMIRQRKQDAFLSAYCDEIWDNINSDTIFGGNGSNVISIPISSSLLNIPPNQNIINISS